MAACVRRLFFLPVPTHLEPGIDEVRIEYSPAFANVREKPCNRPFSALKYVGSCTLFSNVLSIHSIIHTLPLVFSASPNYNIKRISKADVQTERSDIAMANVLIVEDEKNMQEIIADYMRRGGHTCFTADDGVDALMILKNNPMDLMILDIMMPHLDGFSVCKMAREMSNLPIIMLTAKSSEDEKLKGYDLGTDDYMTKPFSPKVLLAKANALLRRSSVAPADGINAGKISIIPASRKVFVDGQETALTHKEYELLYFLMANPGQIFSREQLLNRIWGYDFEGTTRTVDTHIKTLRQKLGDESRHIVTLIRSGYKFEVTP